MSLLICLFICFFLFVYVYLFIHRYLNYSVIPNREPVGFQSLWPGSGDTKMHAPKTGTALEPSWNRGGTLLEPSWNLARTLVEPCTWNLVGFVL